MILLISVIPVAILLFALVPLIFLTKVCLDYFVFNRERYFPKKEVEDMEVEDFEQSRLNYCKRCDNRGVYWPPVGYMEPPSRREYCDECPRGGYKYERSIQAKFDRIGGWFLKGKTNFSIWWHNLRYPKISKKDLDVGQRYIQEFR